MNPSRFGRTALLAALMLGSATAFAQEPAPPVWRDDFQSRLEVYALMQTLSTDILGGTSATRSLEAWCREHRLAETPVIVAKLMLAEDKPASPEQMRHLGVDGQEPVKYRKVQLWCGGQMLSEAENWYVPGRLGADMNALLETTDTPFGKAVAALLPYRQTIAVKLLWTPLPEGWASTSLARSVRGKGRPLEIPAALFEHQAIVYGKDRRPIAEVHETYQRQILALRKAR